MFSKKHAGLTINNLLLFPACGNVREMMNDGDVPLCRAM